MCVHFFYISPNVADFFIFASPFLIIIILLPFVVNRSINIVTISENKITKRGRYSCTIEIADITEVKKITYPIDDEYYVLVDNKHDITTRTKKNSAICVPCNEKGYKFLKSFLSIDIPLYY